MSEAAKAAARSYLETFRQSQDAVGKLVHDAAGFLGSAKLWLDDAASGRGGLGAADAGGRGDPEGPERTTPGPGPGS